MPPRWETLRVDMPEGDAGQGPAGSDELKFCCRGCVAVYQLIHEAGLGLYYQRRETLPGAPPEEVRPRYTAEMLGQFRVDGAYHFLLDGLHCAACVWLIEHALGRLEGVAGVHINYAMARMRVVCDERSVQSIVETVADLGYRAVPYDPRGQERPQMGRNRSLLLRMGVAGSAAANIMLLAFALYCGADDDTQFRSLFHWLSMGICLPVVIYSAFPFFKGAWEAIRRLQLSADVPICLGLSVTYAYSVWATALNLRHVYFDTAATFVFVLLVARNLEGSARSRAGSVVERLLTLTPARARKWVNGKAEEVEAQQLVSGDWVEVLPGEKAPRDGVVREGQGFMDTSALTGESLPVSVTPGSRVLGGSLSLDGRLLVEVSGASLIAQISQFLEMGSLRPSQTQRGADRVARIFLGLSLLCALWTLCFSGVYQAVTVLIVTCPCALGIATPLVVAAVCGQGAAEGLLFRDGATLETIPRLTHLLLDKTGTLTTGKMEVVSVEPAAGTTDEELLRWAASAEASCTHPIARAILAFYQGTLLPLRSLRQIPGQGVVAQVGDVTVSVGRSDYAHGIYTCVEICVDDVYVGRLRLSDKLRPEARELVRELQTQYEVAVASGDHQEPVEAVARELGITLFRASCTPLDKAAWVEELQSRGGVVAVVGDGINDAPALQAADLGVVVERASDISTEVADIVLLRPGLVPLGRALILGREAMRRLRINFALAGIYNLIAIPCAALGYVTPLWAAIAMPVSSLFVTYNSVRAYRGKEVI